MKRVTEMALAKKQNEELIFENRTGATVNDILPDDKTNKVFDEIDGNITGVNWREIIQEPHPNKNQYEELAGKEDDEYNDTKSTGEENDGKITGV